MKTFFPSNLLTFFSFLITDSPEIIGEQRKNFYAKMGTEIQLPCTVTAEPDPMFQWLRDEMIIYNNTKGYTIFNTHNSSALQVRFLGISFFYSIV